MSRKKVSRRSGAEGWAAAEVGRGRAPLDVGDFDETEVRVDVKENPPVADSPAPGRRLMLQGLDVARERVACHLLQGFQDAFPIRTRRASDALSSGLSDFDLPVLLGAHRGWSTLRGGFLSDPSRCLSAHAA